MLHNASPCYFFYKRSDHLLCVSAITSDEKYCYVHDTCNGGHPDELPALTGFGECCSNGGKSWGLADGHEDSFCQPCPVDGDFAGDPRDMLKPGGNPWISVMFIQ